LLGLIAFSIINFAPPSPAQKRPKIPIITSELLFKYILLPFLLHDLQVWNFNRYNLGHGTSKKVRFETESSPYRQLLARRQKLLVCPAIPVPEACSRFY
jgi:hypothetical protein